jgi:putative intracellular protease/amidase
VPAELADDIVGSLAESHPDLDCIVYPGGQTRYLLLLGVE